MGVKVALDVGRRYHVGTALWRVGLLHLHRRSVPRVGLLIYVGGAARVCFSIAVRGTISPTLAGGHLCFDRMVLDLAIVGVDVAPIISVLVRFPVN